MAAVFTGTPEQLHALLRQLPAILAGRAPDPWGVARGLQLRLGNALLSKIQQAFVVKSRGGTGEDGVTWPKMRPASIAARRLDRGEKKALGIGGRRVRGLLTPAQDRRWRALFAGNKARLMVKFGLGEAEASARAAQLAWGILKAEGAQTKLAVLGGRQVDMCRDSGLYFKSLTPGVEDRPSGAADQVLTAEPGKVVVGSNRPYAARQHALRPLWPRGGGLPPAWAQALLGTYQRGLVEALTRIAGPG